MRKCEESQIVINTATLEKIVFDPQSVLENEESFWEDESPQKYTKLWAESVGYSDFFNKWREQMREWADIPLEERKEHVLMRNCRRILEEKENFSKKALPHLCSYLPECADLNVTVYLTAFIPPYAFAWADKNISVIISINSPYWKNNVENILNLLVHEVFHAGYSYCRDLRTEEKPESEDLYNMLESLHNEGICTYLGYRAMPLFPAPDVKDYKLLDNEADVIRLLGDVNEVFSKVGELSGKEIQKLAWDKCVVERGYYAVGAYMCKVIEGKRGKEALVETLLQGPVSFVKLYNSLVKGRMKVRVE